MRPPLALVALLAAALAGCDALTHEPSGENVVDVDPTVAPLDVDLASAPDTLALWGRATLRPGFDAADGRPVRRVEVLLGDRVVGASDSPTSVTAETGRVEDGTYTLRVRAVASSGTGSLADRLGREEVIGEVTRIAVVDNAPPTPVAVTSLGPEAGRLVVRWERYGRRNFQEYRVYDVAADGRRTLRARIERAATTAWADSSFVAGEARYAVEVLAGGQTAPGEPAARRFEPPTVVEGRPTSTSEIRVAWTATPFTVPFGAYFVVRRGENEFEMPRVVARVTEPGDTTLVDRVPDKFGAVYTYSVRTERADGAAYGGDPLGVPLDAQAAVGSVGGYGAGAFVGLSPDGRSLVRLDGGTFEATGSLPLGFEPREVAVSPGGLALALGVGQGPVHLVDVPSFSVVNAFPLGSLIGPNAYLSDVGQSGPARLTDGGLYLSSYVEIWSPALYAGLGVVALDARAGRVAARLDAEGTRPPSFRVDYDPVFLGSASPDGRFVVTNEYPDYVLYERTEAGGFVRLATVGSVNPISGVLFVGDRQLAVMEPGNSRVRVLEVPSLREVGRFRAPALHDLSYDPGSGLLFGAVSMARGLFYTAYDPRDGRLVFTIESAGRARLFGGVLWSGGAYRRVAPLSP